MKEQWQYLIPIFAVIIECIAAILLVFGFYQRFLGERNPTGGIYIFIGGCVGILGAIILFIFKRGS